MCDPTCTAPVTSYLPVWNGHSDATALYRINTDGSLSLANSYQYGTWGTPAKSATCANTHDKVEMVYDGEGRRTAITSDPAGATAATTREFRYQGDAIVEERVDGVLDRSYLVDESGSVLQLDIPSGRPGTGRYLVTYNGHGDAFDEARSAGPLIHRTRVGPPKSYGATASRIVSISSGPRGAVAAILSHALTAARTSSTMRSASEEGSR